MPLFFFFLLVGSLGADETLLPLRQSEGCGSDSEAKYSGRYMMRDRGRQLHTESESGKMDCSGVNNNGRVRAQKSPTRPSIIIENSVGSCCIPQESTETCAHNVALVLQSVCVCVCICVCLGCVERERA